MSTSVQNYTVVGNPTISSDYIASNFTDSDYIVCGRSKSTGTYTIILKVTVDSLPSANTPILTQTYDFTTGGETVQAVGAYVGLNFFEVGGSTVGPYFALRTDGNPTGVTLNVSANTSYWLKLEASSSGGNYASLKVIQDNNYTIDTLPTSGWSSTYDSASSDILHNATSYVGYYSTLSNSTVSVDLKTLRMIQNNSIVWGAVYILEPVSGVSSTNYRIIGSPTFADGVYSDFSSSDYLVIPSVLKNTNYSYFFKFTTGANVNTMQYVAHAEQFFSIEIDQGNVKCWSWDSQTGGDKTLFACSANTTYWVRCEYSGSTRTYSHSTDGSHWTQDLQFTDDGLQTNENGYDFKVGLESWDAVDPFLGSVDFNEVFVVDNSTMLPVWSPYTRLIYTADYTVVGSPTISSDYVASNFSDSNYLFIDDPLLNTNSSFEISAAFVLLSDTQSNCSIIDKKQVDQTTSVRFEINSDRHIQARFSNVTGSYEYFLTLTGSTTIQYNTKYYTKLIYNSSTGYKILLSTDGTNWVQEATSSLTTKPGTSNREGLIIGDNSATGSSFPGELYLKDMQIKVDGEVVWVAVDRIPKYEGGSLFVSQGYYTDGSHEIIVSPMTVSLQNLVDGHQKLDYKNTVYAASKNDVASIHLVGDSQTFQGSYDVSVDLEHPVYVSNLKNYIVGDSLVPSIDLTYTSGVVTEWNQPRMTSATTYGTCSDSRNNSGEEGWRCLDGYVADTTNRFGPALTAGWWMWSLPVTVRFKAGTSVIKILNAVAQSTMSIQFFADQAKTKPITGVITLAAQTTSYQSFTVSTTQTTSVIYMDILAHSAWVCIGDLLFEGVDEIHGDNSIVSTSSGVIYDEATSSTFWYPTSVTKTLEQLKSQASLSDVNELFYTNSIKEDVSDIVASPLT